MGDALLIAVSGLNAASLRLSTAANNIANANDTGELQPAPGQSQPFQPQQVAQEAAPGGGTIATDVPVTPASNPSPDPNSPLANAQGLVAVPNVDTAQELVNTQVASFSYDANLKVVETASKMQGYLLNIFA
ncbi:MAG TPA: flagellar basal body rod C-terminal domain-containing protein [Stellaceae bacterium]|nr:flagellar basal body rod C-terminal domain-containing protein [Stellaceae bacterium]